MNDRKTNTNGRTLRRLLRGSWRYFAACIAASLLFTVCELVIPQIIRVSVDSLIGNAPVKVAAAKPIVAALGGVDRLRRDLWIPAALMAGFGLLSAIMRYCVNLYSSKAGETLVKTSRDLLYHHIQHLPWKWHMENPTGDIIQRCTSDVERIKTFFEEQFVPVFRMIAMIVFALVCMALMNWKLALVPAVMFPIIIVYSLLFHNSIRERFTACDESEGVLSTIAQENLTGVRVVRAFGREEYERERFEKQNEDYTSLWVRLCRTLSDFWAVGDATACIQTMLVVVLGSLLCVRGEMTEGEFVSFAIYNTMSISPVRRLGRVISEMSKMGVSVSRISEVLDAPCEQDKPDAEPAPMDGDIVFDHVTFRYETGPDVLSDVSFTIPAGTSFGGLRRHPAVQAKRLFRVRQPVGGLRLGDLLRAAVAGQLDGRLLRAERAERIAEARILLLARREFLVRHPDLLCRSAVRAFKAQLGEARLAQNRADGVHCAAVRDDEQILALLIGADLFQLHLVRRFIDGGAERVKRRLRRHGAEQHARVLRAGRLEGKRQRLPRHKALARSDEAALFRSQPTARVLRVQDLLRRLQGIVVRAVVKQLLYRLAGARGEEASLCGIIFFEGFQCGCQPGGSPDKLVRLAAVRGVKHGFAVRIRQLLRLADLDTAQQLQLPDQLRLFLCGAVQPQFFHFYDCHSLFQILSTIIDTAASACCSAACSSALHCSAVCLFSSVSNASACSSACCLAARSCCCAVSDSPARRAAPSFSACALSSAACTFACSQMARACFSAAAMASISCIANSFTSRIAPAAQPVFSRPRSTFV